MISMQLGGDCPVYEYDSIVTTLYVSHFVSNNPAWCQMDISKISAIVCVRAMCKSTQLCLMSLRNEIRAVQDGLQRGFTLKTSVHGVCTKPSFYLAELSWRKSKNRCLIIMEVQAVKVPLPMHTITCARAHWIITTHLLASIY